MHESYSSRFWRRIYVIDNDGIHECKLSGQPIKSIRWEDVYSFRGRRLIISKAQQPSIAVRLPRPASVLFRSSFSIEWRERYPEAWSRCQKEIYRGAITATFLWFPLLIGIPLVVVCLSKIVIGKNPLEDPSLIHVTVLFTLALILTLYLFFSGRRSYLDGLKLADQAKMRAREKEAT